MRLLISIGILGLFGMVVVWFVILNQYLRTLKNNYYQLWVELGKPAVFTNNTPQTNVAVFRHLRTRAYQLLSDHDLSAGRSVTFILHILSNCLCSSSGINDDTFHYE